jgi:O-antigen/teichoic acid export membrane protein
VITTLACVPLALWLRNYSAMLGVLILQAAVYVIGTHLVAHRTYGWAWDRKYIARIFLFGWPLLINGLLMYVIFQGDGVIIGASHRLFAHSHFTLTDLGVYSVAFSLTMAPSMLVANVVTSIFLPLLSRVQAQREQLARNYAICAEIVAFMAALIGIPFAIAGGPVVALIYGQKYAAAAEVIGWLAAMWAVRTVRMAPTLGAMASGDTRNSMLSNIARTFALPCVVAVAAAGLGLKWIAVCGFGGELLALAVSVRRLQRRENLGIGKCVKPSAVAASATLMAILLVPHWNVSSWPVVLSLSAVWAVFTCTTLLILFPELRRYFQGFFLSTPPSNALQNVSST